MSIVNDYGKIFTKILSSYTASNSINRYLTAEETERLSSYVKNWNFYLGYHYEDIPLDDETPYITENWCKRFVDKYVSTEFCNGFTFKFDKSVENNILPFLNSVWVDNNGSELMLNVGQCKSITGDAYVQVHFERAGEFDDPFNAYPKGRIRLFPIPSSLVFPKYKDGYNNSWDALESISIIYNIEGDRPTPTGDKNITVKYEYFKDRVVYSESGKVDIEYPNPYGVIPIVHFRNLPLSGSNFGLSDLVDVIPLNVELNLKSSNISEILAYHAAPTTIVQGARINQLERGANNVWGGLPKDAKVYNLELSGDLGASNKYIDEVKTSMFEIACMPKLALGGEMPPANFSGTAYQIAFMPLLDLIKTKQIMSASSIGQINRLILKMGMDEGMFTPPTKDLFRVYQHEIVFGDALPRDTAQELQNIQTELKAGLISRRSAMENLGMDYIDDELEDIAQDRKDNPIAYGVTPISISTGNRLVSPEDGKVIVKAEDIGATESHKANPQMDLKNKVGTNRDGEDVKVLTGLEKGIDTFD